MSLERQGCRTDHLSVPQLRSMFSHQMRRSIAVAYPCAEFLMVTTCLRVAMWWLLC